MSDSKKKTPENVEGPRELEETQPVNLPGNYRDFETYCFDVIADWVAKYAPGKKFSMKNATPSPVDIVLVEGGSSLNFMDNVEGNVTIFQKTNEFKNTHFIECKFYSRSIDLDTVAKTVLASIRYKPMSTTLATRTPLTPQAEQYISFFLQGDYLGAGPFCIWEPLKDSACTRLSKMVEPVPSTEGLRDTFNIKYTSLQIEYLFSKVHVDAEAGHQHTNKRPQALRFRATVSPPSGKPNKKLDEAFLVITAPEKHEISWPLQIKQIEASKDLSVEAKVEGERLRPGIDYTSWSLHLRSGKQYVERLFIDSFPPLTVNKFRLSLPDLREKETNSAYEYWEQSGVPITLVSGESGIGKSFFCEQICRRATMKGFTAVQTSMLDDTGTAFIANLAWSVIDPDMQSIVSNGESLDDFIESWCLASTSGKAMEHETRALQTLMSVGTLKDVASEALLETIARMIVNRGIPIIFYAHDLHKAPPVVSDYLWKLVKGFSDAGWGQVKVIFERRDTSTKQNQTLWDNLQLGFKKVLWNCDLVKPLPEGQITDTLASVLACHDNRAAAKKIVKKSGHDLQHMSVVLETLLLKKILKVEGIKGNDKVTYQYTIPSLTKMEQCLREQPDARLNATIELIELANEKLEHQGYSFGCKWLGLLAIIKVSPDVELLAGLTGLSHQDVEEAMEILVDEEFVTERNGKYAFKHESLIEAATSWFNALPLINTWVRQHAVCPCVPTRFKEGLARGRLWQFLNRPDQAFHALNSAIGLVADNFLQRIQCHMEMHKLLVTDKRHERYREFFENCAAIGWYGHYTLPVEEQIALNDEAISFHGRLSMLDYPEPQNSQTLSKLHRINAWLHIQDLDQKRYFSSSRAALASTTDIHEIAMMLNRYILLCRHWGIYSSGIKGVLASIVLCEEVPFEKDKDLRSVNYSMSAPLVTESEAGIKGRLRFLEESCANPHATRRELAHTKLALANTLTVCGKLQDSSEAIAYAKDVMDKKSMESLGISYYQSLGLWYAAKSQWTMAQEAFSNSLSKASWLGQRLEALKAGQNLLIAYVKEQKFDEGRVLFPILLKQCVDGFSDPDFLAAENLLEDMLQRSTELLTANSPHLHQDSIENRMEQKAREYGINYPPDHQYSANVFYAVLSNSSALSTAYPEHFILTDEAKQLWERDENAPLRLAKVSGLSCKAGGEGALDLSLCL